MLKLIPLSLSLFLMSCPAKLETSPSAADTQQTTPAVPPEFGVNERDDCDQAAIGSSVCNLVLYDQNEEVWELI